MFIPSPSFVPLVRTENIDSFFSAFTGIENVAGGVAVYGSAAAYALVWELGSKQLKSPGPKTLWSLNRNNEPAILTRQAPRGYVGFYEDSYWKIIEEELSTVTFKGSDARTTHLQIQVAVDNASQRIAALISAQAPKDSGDLASQISMVDSDESEILGSANSESDATFIL